MKSICFVVATKDRPDELRRMLESLAAQTRLPERTIVVDSSANAVSYVTDEFRQRLHVRYMHHNPPSASGQRNAGVAAVPPSMDLIAFLDDDATLEPEALERMMEFWANAPADMGGAAFNMVNHPAQQMSRVKRWPLIRALGVYNREPGRVTPSGWQTMTGFVSSNVDVDWLPSTASVWRAVILRDCRFDDFFTGYSYLEDLDFSYTVRRNWRLAIAANAHYHHYPSTVRHSRQYGFGKTEVRNRLYFVAKHGLSYRRCWLGLTLRMGLTICNAVGQFDRGSLSRAWGNCVAMVTELKNSTVRRFIKPSGEQKGLAG